MLSILIDRQAKLSNLVKFSNLLTNMPLLVANFSNTFNHSLDYLLKNLSNSSNTFDTLDDQVKSRLIVRSNNLSQIENFNHLNILTKLSANLQNGSRDILILPGDDLKVLEYLEKISSIFLNNSTLTTTTASEGAQYNWLVLLLGIMVFVGIFGNVLVCLAVLIERRLQNATNYFLLSLAIADLLVSALVMPISIVNEVYGECNFIIHYVHVHFIAFNCCS